MYIFEYVWFLFWRFGFAWVSDVICTSIQTSLIKLKVLVIDEKQYGKGGDTKVKANAAVSEWCSHISDLATGSTDQGIAVLVADFTSSSIGAEGGGAAAEEPKGFNARSKTAHSFYGFDKDAKKVSHFVKLSEYPQHFDWSSVHHCTTQLPPTAGVNTVPPNCPPPLLYGWPTSAPQTRCHWCRHLHCTFWVFFSSSKHTYFWPRPRRKPKLAWRKTAQPTLKSNCPATATKLVGVLASARTLHGSTWSPPSWKAAPPMASWSVATSSFWWTGKQPPLWTTKTSWSSFGPPRQSWSCRSNGRQCRGRTAITKTRKRRKNMASRLTFVWILGIGGGVLSDAACTQKSTSTRVALPVVTLLPLSERHSIMNALHVSKVKL